MLTTPSLTAPSSNPTASGLLRRGTVGFVTTLSDDIIASGHVIPLVATAGLSADTAVTIVIAPKTDKQEVVIGFPESNTLVNSARGVEGTAYDHTEGDTVVMFSTAIDHNSVIDFLLTDHNPDGSHKTIPDAASLATIKAVYPVGSVYLSVLSTNPASVFGFGTWVAFATGRTIVGVDASQTEFATVEETGGEKTHILTATEMPSHNHAYTYLTYSGGGANAAGTYTPTRDVVTTINANTNSTGGGAAHNNLQPYVTTYMWKRTA